MTHHHPLSFLDHGSFLLDNPNTSLNWLTPNHQHISHWKFLFARSKHFIKSADAWPSTHWPSMISFGNQKHSVESHQHPTIDPSTINNFLWLNQTLRLFGWPSHQPSTISLGEFSTKSQNNLGHRSPSQDDIDCQFWSNFQTNKNMYELSIYLIFPIIEMNFGHRFAQPSKGSQPYEFLNSLKWISIVDFAIKHNLNHRFTELCKTLQQPLKIEFQPSRLNLTLQLWRLTPSNLLNNSKSFKLKSS